MEDKLTVTKGERGRGGKGEIGINRYTLLYIQQINNKDLLIVQGTILNIL